MANLTYRITSNPSIPGSSNVKGSSLTYQEMDANLKSIDNDLVELKQDVEQQKSDTLALTLALG